MALPLEDILETILTTRKSWKTLKGQTEAVWPPHLEATMLKALQEYVPEDSRETRILGRFPMRNRFISDYIYRATGKFRSAKQVGSRLQQLRDTSQGRLLIDALTRSYRPQSANDPFSILTDLPPSSPQTCPPPSFDILLLDDRSMPPSAHSQVVESRSPVFIDILPDSPHALPSTASLSPSSTTPGPARRMRDIDPTVTFVSSTPITGKSSYIVLLDGAPIHSEDTRLEYIGPYCPSQSPSSSSSSSSIPSPSPARPHAHASHPQDSPVLYNTALVPRYWDVLCRASDPALYTIIQDVYRAPDIPSPSPSLPIIPRPRPVKVFSAIYHFRYPPALAVGTAVCTAPSSPSYSGSYASQVYSSPSAMPTGYPTTSPSSSTLFPMLALRPGGIAHAVPETGSIPYGGQGAAQVRKEAGYNRVGQGYGYPHGQGYAQGQSQTQAQAHPQAAYTSYTPYPSSLPASPTTATFSPMPPTYRSPLATAGISAETMTTPREEDFFTFVDLEPSPANGGNPGGVLDVSIDASASGVSGGMGSAGVTGNPYYM